MKGQAIKSLSNTFIDLQGINFFNWFNVFTHSTLINIGQFRYFIIAVLLLFIVIQFPKCVV